MDVIKFLAENSGDPHLQRIKDTANQHAKLMEASSRTHDAEKALFEDDEDAEEEGQVGETDKTNAETQEGKSNKKVKAVFEDIQETKAGHCIQTVRELQSVPVIVSADLTVCPPVIK